MSGRLRATFAILALAILGACAHRNDASSDTQTGTTAAPTATGLTQPTDDASAMESPDPSSPPAQSSDESAAAVSSDSSSPPVSQAENPAATGDAQSSTPAGTDSPVAAAAQTGDEPQCIALEAESYCKAWSDDNDLRTQTEYVRSGETVDAWKRMITIVRYKQLGSLNEVMPTYMKLIGPSIYPRGAQPVFIKPDASQHKEEIATRFILSGTDASNNEYTVAYFRADATPPAYALVFSQHIVAGMDTPSMTLYHSWINDLRAVKL
jgi:hypothetical protein